MSGGAVRARSGRGALAVEAITSTPPTPEFLRKTRGALRAEARAVAADFPVGGNRQAGKLAATSNGPSPLRRQQLLQVRADALGQGVEVVAALQAAHQPAAARPAGHVE